MKKLVLSIISILFLVTSTAQAVIFARQVWQHPNGKTVELFSDVHTQLPEPIDQRDLLTNIGSIVKKQQENIIQYAQLFGDKAHLFIEDFATFYKDRFPHRKENILKLENPETRDTLSMLISLCKDRRISCTNIECRTSLFGVSKELQSTIKQYDDGPKLNHFYLCLRLKDFKFQSDGKIHTDPSSIMDVSVIHRMYEYTHNKNPELTTKDRLLIVAGGAHIRNYSQALPLMGYKQIHTKQRVSPMLQKIIHKAECAGEEIIQHITKYLLGTAKNCSYFDIDSLEEEDKEFVTKYFSMLEQNCSRRYYLENLPPENQLWTAAFWITNPLDIGQIIEEERKTMAIPPAAAAETKEIAALRAAAPAVATPVIRARL